MATLMPRLDQIIPPATPTENNTNATDGKIAYKVNPTGCISIDDRQ